MIFLNENLNIPWQLFSVKNFLRITSTAEAREFEENITEIK